eukprot:422348-Ditylum_brightwellii.AAC.1
MEWYKNALPMQPNHGLILSDFPEMEESYFIQLKDKLFGKDWLHIYATKILNAKYEITDVIGVVNRQDHLTQSQKDDKLYVLWRHQQMFDVKPGVLAPQNESKWAYPTFIIPKKDCTIQW